MKYDEHIHVQYNYAYTVQLCMYSTLYSPWLTCITSGFNRNVTRLHVPAVRAHTNPGCW